MKKIPAICKTNYNIKFNLGINLYQNIMTFLKDNNILFLSEIKLNFDNIPLELHGRGNSENLIDYLENNNNNNELIIIFLKYFISNIVNIRGLNDELIFIFYENLEWQNINIEVSIKKITTTTTTLAPTTTTTTTLVSTTTTTTTNIPISNILLGTSSYSGGDTLAKSYDFGMSVSGIGNAYFGASTDYFSNCGGILFGSGYNSDWSETQFKYSLDSGLTWTDVPTTIYEPSNTNQVEEVAWNGNIFIAAIDGGANTLAYSYDGLTWSGLGNSIFTLGARCIIWDGNKFISGGDGSDNVNILAYSYDGLNWSGLGYTSIMLTVNNIAYNFNNGSPKYVAVGNSPTKPNSIIYSSDGLNWIGAGLPCFDYAGTQVIYANSLFVGVGMTFNTGATVGYSSDGINWSTSLLLSNLDSVYTVAWTGDRYMIGGYLSSGALLKYSFDLITFYDITNTFDGVGCIEIFN